MRSGTQWTDERNQDVSPVAAEMTALIAQLNEQFVDLLCAGVGDEIYPKSVTHSVWQELSAAARNKLAAFPVLLPHVRFQDSQWWRDVAHGLGVGCFHELNVGEACAAERMTRNILFVAWHATSSSSVALFRFGMTRSVAASVARLTLVQIEGIAAMYHKELRARWNSDAAFWSALLACAHGGDEERWSGLKSHALQLLGRDLFRGCGDSAERGDANQWS